MFKMGFPFLPKELPLGPTHRNTSRVLRVFLPWDSRIPWAPTSSCSPRTLQALNLTLHSKKTGETGFSQLVVRFFKEHARIKELYVILCYHMLSLSLLLLLLVLLIINYHYYSYHYC